MKRLILILAIIGFVGVGIDIWFILDKNFSSLLIVALIQLINGILTVILAAIKRSNSEAR